MCFVNFKEHIIFETILITNEIENQICKKKISNLKSNQTQAICQHLKKEIPILFLGLKSLLTFLFFLAPWCHLLLLLVRFSIHQKSLNKNSQKSSLIHLFQFQDSYIAFINQVSHVLTSSVFFKINIFVTKNNSTSFINEIEERSSK